MHSNTLYWLHMEKINDKPKFTTVVPYGWGRTAMALSMGIHRASILPVIVFLKCCDEYMATISFSNLFWVPEISHLYQQQCASLHCVIQARASKEPWLWHWTVWIQISLFHLLAETALSPPNLLPQLLSDISSPWLPNEEQIRWKLHGKVSCHLPGVRGHYYYNWSFPGHRA